MKIVKLLIFICLLIAIVFVANFFNNSKTDYENSSKTSFTENNLIGYGNEGIKTLASLSFKSSWENLSKMFEINQNDLRDKILKKKIDIKESAGNLVVFVGDNSIEQITVYLESDIDSNEIDDFFKKIITEIENHNIVFDKEIIEDSNGESLADIATYRTESYKIIVTKIKSDNKKSISIDLKNLRIL